VQRPKVESAHVRQEEQPMNDCPYCANTTDKVIWSNAFTLALERVGRREHGDCAGFREPHGPRTLFTHVQCAASTVDDSAAQSLLPRKPKRAMLAPSLQ
jgi:hypothetical protein